MPNDYCSKNKTCFYDDGNQHNFTSTKLLSLTSNLHTANFVGTVDIYLEFVVACRGVRNPGAYH